MTLKLQIRPTAPTSLNTFSVIVIGVIYLLVILDIIGWIFGIPFLRGFKPGWNPMMLSTAVCLGLAATSLLFIRIDHHSRILKSGSAIIGSLICIVAILTIASYSVFLSTGNEADWIRAPFLNLFLSPDKRMALITAIQSLAAGGVLLMLLAENTRVSRYAHLIVIPVVASSYFIPVCYILGVQDMMILSWGGTTVSLNSGIAFCLLGIGILATNKESWLMKIYLSRYAGSIMVRRMLPMLFLLPIIIAWLSLLGMRSGAVSMTEGEVWVAIIYTVCFCILLAFTTKSVNGFDKTRESNEAEVLKSNQRLEILSTTARNLLMSEKPQKIVDTLCQNIMEFLDCQVFFNFLMVSEPYRHLELNACGGIPEITVRALKRLELGSAVCGCVARDGFPIIIRDIQNNNDPRADLVRTFGVQAYACHPLLDKGKVIGTLSFGTRTRAEFSADEVSLMKVVTDEVAIAMARKKSEEEIIQLNQNLEKHVLERTIKLEESLKEMEAFTYSVSHDLRAPLRHIAGYVGLLNKKSGAGLDPEIHKYLKVISEAAEKMGILIDDILDFAKLSRAEMSTQTVSVGELLDDVLEMTSQDCKGRAIKWEIGALPLVKGDPAMLRIVLMNLLTNAIKFTSKNSDTRIMIGQVAQEEDFITIFVRDNGKGFDMKYSDKLFGLFQRLHDEKEFPGTGLGLAITKKIIERHGGKIWAEGLPEKGAAFYFSLPRAEMKGHDEAVKKEISSKVRWP